MKIKNKIILYFLLAFVALVTLAGVLGGYLSFSDTKRIVENNLEELNNIKAEAVTSFLKSKKEVASMLGSSTVFRDFLKTKPGTTFFETEKERAKQRLIRSKADMEDILEIFIFDKNGVVLVSSGLIPEGVNLSEKIGLKDNVLRETVIGNLYLSETLNRIVLPAVSPLTNDQTGDFMGAVVVFFDQSFLNNIVFDLLGETREGFLVNEDGLFITQPKLIERNVVLLEKLDTKNKTNCFLPEEKALVINEGYDGPGQGHAGHELVYEHVDYRNKNIFGTHAYIPEVNWCLITKVDQAEILKITYILLAVFGIICLLAVIVFYLIARWLAKKITEPIFNLQSGVEKIQEGNLDFNLNINSKDEFGVLADGFNKMREAVKGFNKKLSNEVKEKTKEINEKLQEIEKKNSLAEKSQMALMNILDDIKISEDKTKEETNKIKAMVSSMGEGLILVDSDIKIQIVNQAAAILLKIAPADMEGKFLGDVFCLKTKDKNICDIGWIKTEVVEKHNILNYGMESEFYCEKKDGKLFPVEIIASPFLLGLEVKGALLIFRDITKEKNLDEAKNSFISVASHQLRTPLTSIRWYAEMLSDGDVGKVNKEQKEFVDKIYNGAVRLNETINMLLVLARVESGRTEAEKESVDLPVLIKEVISDIDNQLKSKKLKVSVLAEASLEKINSDPTILRQIITNLLSNSIRYTETGGKIEVAVKKAHNHLMVSVKDDGIGIPENQRGRIFEKFFRADNAVEKVPDGSGLGLCLVKSLVEVLGGSVYFQSPAIWKDNDGKETKKGTEFYFDLPFVN